MEENNVCPIGIQLLYNFAGLFGKQEWSTGLRAEIYSEVEAMGNVNPDILTSITVETPEGEFSPTEEILRGIDVMDTFSTPAEFARAFYEAIFKWLIKQPDSEAENILPNILLYKFILILKGTLWTDSMISSFRNEVCCMRMCPTDDEEKLCQKILVKTVKGLISLSLMDRIAVTNFFETPQDMLKAIIEATKTQIQKTIEKVESDE